MPLKFIEEVRKVEDVSEIAVRGTRQDIEDQVNLTITDKDGRTLEGRNFREVRFLEVDGKVAGKLGNGYRISVEPTESVTCKVSEGETTKSLLCVPKGEL